MHEYLVIDWNWAKLLVWKKITCVHVGMRSISEAAPNSVSMDAPGKHLGYISAA